MFSNEKHVKTNNFCKLSISFECCSSKLFHHFFQVCFHWMRSFKNQFLSLWSLPINFPTGPNSSIKIFSESSFNRYSYQRYHYDEEHFSLYWRHFSLLMSRYANLSFFFVFLLVSPSLSLLSLWYDKNEKKFQCSSSTSRSYRLRVNNILIKKKTSPSHVMISSFKRTRKKSLPQHRSANIKN